MRTIKKGSLPPSGWEFVPGSRTQIREIKAESNMTSALRDELRSLLTNGLLIGEKGEPGRDGKDGLTGRQGESGKNGRDGSHGKDGARGDVGPAGKDGRNGKDGKPGKDGKDGKQGAPGKDAPYIVDIKPQGKDLVVYMSDGKKFRFTLPSNKSISFGAMPPQNNNGGGGTSNVHRTAALDADGATTTFSVPEGEYVAGTGRLYYRGQRIKPALFDETATGFTTNFTFGAPKQDSSTPGQELIYDYETLT